MSELTWKEQWEIMAMEGFNSEQLDDCVRYATDVLRDKHRSWHISKPLFALAISIIVLVSQQRRLEEELAKVNNELQHERQRVN